VSLIETGAAAPAERRYAGGKATASVAEFPLRGPNAASLSEFS
jgi:hypothetical protein